MATSGTKIVIEINGNINTTTSATSGGDNESSLENTNDLGSSNAQRKSNESFLKAAKKVGAIKLAKKTILNSVDISVNRNLSLTENYIGQQSLTNVKTALGKAESLFTSVAFGASVGGPVGAAVAVASWGTSQYFEYRQKMEGYYRALNAANAQTEFGQTRAGLYNEGKGTLN